MTTPAIVIELTNGNLLVLGSGEPIATTNPNFLTDENGDVLTDDSGLPLLAA